MLVFSVSISQTLNRQGMGEGDRRTKEGGGMMIMMGKYSYGWKRPKREGRESKKERSDVLVIDFCRHHVSFSIFHLDNIIGRIILLLFIGFQFLVEFKSFFYSGDFAEKCGVVDTETSGLLKLGVSFVSYPKKQ